MIHRRTSREMLAKGGWNIFHAATVTASTCGSSATSFVIRGQGAGGCYGWWAHARVEELPTVWGFPPMRRSGSGWPRESATRGEAI